MEQGEKLKHSASVDFLTGVYNRATIEKKIEETLEKRKAGTFLLVDVDNFKSVNDVLGHPVGDLALKQIAGILKEFFRKEDYIGRLGGDEFCVFMQDVVDLEVIKKKAENLNEKCRIAYQGQQGETVNISVSLGITLCNRENNTYEEIYKYADLALYETKKKGRDSFTIYSGKE